MLTGIHVRLDPETLTRVSMVAKAAGVSRSFLISLVLNEWLETQNGEDRATAEAAKLVKRHGGIVRMRRYRTAGILDGR